MSSDSKLLAFTVNSFGVSPNRNHIAVWHYKDRVKEFDGREWKELRPEEWERLQRARMIQQASVQASVQSSI